MPGGRVSVREARPDERRGAADLTAAAYQEYAGHYGARWDGYLGTLRRTVETSAATHLVAELDGDLVGSVLLFMPGADAGYPGAPALTRPEVRFLAVAPGFRGRRIGEALMRAVCLHASAAGSTEVRLHTLEFMAAARDLYRRLGFMRAPETDVRSPMGAVAEGYRLALSHVTGNDRGTR